MLIVSYALRNAYSILCLYNNQINHTESRLQKKDNTKTKINGYFIHINEQESTSDDDNDNQCL